VWYEVILVMRKFVVAIVILMILSSSMPVSVGVDDQIDDNTTPNRSVYPDQMSQDLFVNNLMKFHAINSTSISLNHVPFDRMIDEDEEPLAHERHLQYKLEQAIRAAGIEKSNYTFSLHGNVKLLWYLYSYIKNHKINTRNYDYFGIK
jgi:hypothetical protein